ncbi:MAG: type II secretion system major pseudopilin GspG [Geminicoccaceae bacterium]
MICVRKRRRPAADTGFSLIELLVVMGILALLAGFIGPQVIGYLGRAKEQTAATQIESLRAALDLYLLDVGRYPDERQGLAPLAENVGNQAGWQGPYLRDGKLPADPWGNPYGYRLDQGTREPVVFSLGADGASGGIGENADIGL